MTEERKIVNAKEVSAYLAISIKTIFEWADRGVIPIEKRFLPKT